MFHSLRNQIAPTVANSQLRERGVRATHQNQFSVITGWFDADNWSKERENSRELWNSLHWSRTLQIVS